MKTSILLLYVLLFALTAQSCGNAGDTAKTPVVAGSDKNADAFDSDEAVEMLKQFYTAYTEDASGQHFDNLDEVKRHYFTPGLYKKFQSAQLDYDPVLNAQDVAGDILETLEISPDQSKKGLYKVCYLFGESEICTELLLVKIDGRYLINDIPGYNDWD